MTDTSTDGSWVIEKDQQFSIKEKDNTSDIDLKLIAFTYRIEDKLFGSHEEFISNFSSRPKEVPYAGIDAEVRISKVEFEKWIASNKSKETFKYLYYYDFESLVGSLQNLVQESRNLFIEFYKTLNENSFMLNNKPTHPDAVMFTAGSIITPIFSKINHLFINLASQLDFITKIFVEFENMPADFNDYPKLKSSGILFGDCKKIKTIPFVNTIFDKTSDIKLIISLRNDLIHNSSFENISKVYHVFKNNVLMEKFILVPDNTDGIFDSYKNRNRFFYNDIKINEILPSLVTGFWKKIETTIDGL